MDGLFVWLVARLVTEAEDQTTSLGLESADVGGSDSEDDVVAEGIVDLMM